MTETENRNFHAWISNIAFPTSAEELLNQLQTGEGFYDTEVIVKARSGVRWTVPTWAHRGDIIFFMHSVSAINKIRGLRREILQIPENVYSEEELTLMRQGLERAMDLYHSYGGKLIGAARLATNPVRGNTESFRHWRGRTYAEIDQTCAFEVPLDHKLFRERISISRTGGVTPLFEENYRYLCGLLSENNQLPEYLSEACLPGSDCGTEDGFRAQCVDGILHAISPRVYRECRCRKAGVPDSFADNVVLIEGKYLPVEVKLRWNAEAICDQLWKYCNNESIETCPGGEMLTQDRVWRFCALLIDPQGASIYDARVNRLIRLIDMETVRSDPFDLRDAVSAYLHDGEASVSREFT